MNPIHQKTYWVSDELADYNGYTITLNNSRECALCDESPAYENLNDTPSYDIALCLRCLKEQDTKLFNNKTEAKRTLTQ